MKLKALLVIALVAVLFVSSASAVATNFSVAELGFTGPQTIYMYQNDTLLGTYNTTSDAIPIPDGDFILVIKPETTNREPIGIMNDLLAYASDNIVALVLLFGLVGLIVGRRL